MPLADLLPGTLLPTVTFCIEDWPQDEDRHTFGLFTLIIIFVVPSLTLAVCYIHVGRMLCHSENYRAASDSSSINVSRLACFTFKGLDLV